MKGNVLVIGNSGVGKSTLINAVLGEETAKTGCGISGTTIGLDIYENNQIPFRLIDTIGFEPNPKNKKKAIKAVQKWSKNSMKEGTTDTQINAIWFCVDGTSRKLFTETIESLLKATDVWKTIPIITVITKSYSVPDRTENIRMVKDCFRKQRDAIERIRGIIPVVADVYNINESTFVPTEGISEIIDLTNKIMPEGINAAKKDIERFILERKRAHSHTTVVASTTAASMVGAIPVPFSDALILGPIEAFEIKSIAKQYEIESNDSFNNLLNTIIEVGTVGVAAKALISTLKAIPGINIAASVLNAVVAGAIVASIGESCIYVFEKIYIGEKTVDDIDWIKKICESNIANGVLEKVKAILEQVDEKDTGSLTKTIKDVLFNSKKA